MAFTFRNYSRATTTVGISAVKFYLLLIYTVVDAQVYLHMPRGSNNRLDESSRAGRNCDRLFESYNDKGRYGGYNKGSKGPKQDVPPKMYFYEGSRVNFQWTSQHACGGGSTNCAIILQYMCHDKLRDGNVTDSMPFQQSSCAGDNCEADMRYGMHETLSSYRQCRSTAASPIFGSDNNLTPEQVLTSTATWTRQNSAGYCKTGVSYECPEERDYYPYWKPSEWKDIAVLTSNVSMCNHYRRESQNVKPKGYCELPATVTAWWNACDLASGSRLKGSQKRAYRLRPGVATILHAQDNQSSCEAFTYNHATFKRDVLSAGLPAACRSIIIANDPTQTNPSLILRGRWVEAPSHNIAPPVCREIPRSWENNLGDGPSGFPNSYNWTIPFGTAHESCAVRIRYNVSSNDVDPMGATVGTEKTLKFGFGSVEEARKRGFVLQDSPIVDIFGTPNLQLKLAVSVSNLGGKTFQDRSHAFSIRRRPSHVAQQAHIHNIQVQGKRGNIVQTFPSVEYEFVPNRLKVARGDFVHFQWTGSDTNPLGNEGQGRRGTDRNNAVLQRKATFDEGKRRVSANDTSSFSTNYPANLSEGTLLGWNSSFAEKLALLMSPESPNGTRDPLLNDVGSYFDAGLAIADTPGTFHYMCTRNNEFSMRSQKGRIVVAPVHTAAEAIGQTGGTLSLRSATLVVPPNTLFQMLNFRLSLFTIEECRLLMTSRNLSMFNAGGPVSGCVRVEPEVVTLAPGKNLQLAINLVNRVDLGEIALINVFGTYIQEGGQNWIQSVIRNIDVSTQTVTVATRHGGLFVVQKRAAPASRIASIVATSAAVALLFIGLVVYFAQRPRERVNAVRHAARIMYLSLKPAV